nr:carboxypeptidase-like regulatory domain-containing protein [uncultured Porphyromonas sp.]
MNRMTKWNAPRELMGLLSVGLLLLLLPISLHASSSVLPTSEELTELQSDGKKVVKGVVLDDLGEPLPGVGIRIKGMKGAWGTNASGRFEIPVTKERVIMTFSFVGFKTVEQEVKAGAEVTIQLEEDVDLLDEVV